MFLFNGNTTNISCIFSLHIIIFYDINHDYFVFTGEENSRVQAHIDGDEFSAHILTDETEYNVEVKSTAGIVNSLVNLFLRDTLN